ncbi:ABC transporter ATP-binding protein [Brevundimonas balnearis]|uniref:ABC transporter ATP-binding protein n=1 Tax=Brevundimonas balnearis TaxID=1572858 RepID=A0ABV6R1G1_9CAUL
MADEAPAVALRRVLIRYPGRAPIGPVDLTIPDGEIVALVGASGSGKSTLLRLIAGLEAPSEGEVARAAPRDRVGLVFQAPTLMPWASARTNARLPLDLMGVPRAEADRRAAAALASVGLEDRADATPARLSGGMAMRVSLARALAAEPRLLLLDEPFAALDTVTRRALAEDLHRIWVERRPTMVFVTHDVEDAAHLATRAVVLDATTGAVAETVELPSALPRPDGFRNGDEARAAVERLSAALGRAMGSGR